MAQSAPPSPEELLSFAEQPESKSTLCCQVSIHLDSDGSHRRGMLLDCPVYRGGLEGSARHGVEVYFEESQKLKSFARVDSNGTLPWPVLFEYRRRDQFSSESYCRIN